MIASKRLEQFYGFIISITIFDKSTYYSRVFKIKNMLWISEATYFIWIHNLKSSYSLIENEENKKNRNTYTHFKPQPNVRSKTPGCSV